MSSTSCAAAASSWRPWTSTVHGVPEGQCRCIVAPLLVPLTTVKRPPRMTRLCDVRSIVAISVVSETTNNVSPDSTAADATASANVANSLVPSPPTVWLVAASAHNVGSPPHTKAPPPSAHEAAQPSPSIVFPSSPVSPGPTKPSPHAASTQPATHASWSSELPSSQASPVSTTSSPQNAAV